MLKIKRKLLHYADRLMSDGKLAFVLSYFHNRGKFPDLRQPKDLSELWYSRVMSGKILPYSYLADKYAVRGYIEKLGLQDILTPLFGVYDAADNIDFDVFPQRFALKANFGAGHNYICSNKSKMDENYVRQKVATWFTAKRSGFVERHYNLIERKVVCEEFIDDGNGGFPIDYKFLCINGKVSCILVCADRVKGHADYLPYSREWVPLPHYYKKSQKSMMHIKAPANLNEMIAVAEKLASDIDLVRVDLYSNGSRIWFGEMTLTPAGCIFHRWSNQAINELGTLYLAGKKNQ